MTARRQIRHQTSRGFVVLLIVLSLLVVAGVSVLVVVSSRSTAEARSAEIAKQSSDRLNQAKEALMAYVIQKIDGGQGTRLGNLPTPDIVNGTGTAILYNGTSDTRCLSAASVGGLPAASPTITMFRADQRCLGKFPWKDVPLQVGVVDPHDPAGQVPWLAISPNLSYWDGCLLRANSDLAVWTFSPAATACPAAANAIPYPWLTVVDAMGNPIPVKVAAVLIAAGDPIQTTGRNQNRTAASPGVPGDYLDAIALPLGCTTSCIATFDNANLSNTFVQILPGTRYPANAEDASLAGARVTTFNDHLIYITVEEVIERLQRRVLAEMNASLENFKSLPAGSTGLGLPWAAPYAIATDNGVFNAVSGTSVGMFPFFAPPLTPPPPGFAPPSGHQTTYQWNITALQTVRDCKQVSAAPIRWANVAQGSASEASLLAGVGSGAARWGGTRAIGIMASGSISTPPFAKTFSLWNAQLDCVNAAAPIATDTFTVTRSIIAFDFLCLVNPTINYALAAPGSVQTYSWSCPTNSNATAGVTVSDTLSSPLPAAATYSLPTNGTVSVNQLRYQPIMPAWFFYNEWYKTAFYAVGPSVAPENLAGCGTATSLTVGVRSGVRAVVMQGGASLTGASRPSSPPADYLEGKNATSTTDCIFEDTNNPRSSVYNDQLMVVSP